MLTQAQINTDISADEIAAEIFPSDAEVAKRVFDIRRNWNMNERIARRDEADDRFANLIETLTRSVAA